MRLIYYVTIALLACALAGCGAPSEIESKQSSYDNGKVVYEGKPYTGTIIYDGRVSGLPPVRGFTIDTVKGIALDADNGRVDFEDGVQSGRVTLRKGTTLVLEGSLQADDEDSESIWVGEQKVYTSNGHPGLFQSFNNEGQRHGQLVLYCGNASGRKDQSVQFTHGEVTGTRQHFYCDTEEDQIAMESTNSEGGYISKQWYRNGQLKSEEFFKQNDKKDEKDGPSVSYYNDGQVQAKGQFAKGLKTGKWQYWHANGQLEKTLDSDEHGPKGYVSVFDNGGTGGLPDCIQPNETGRRYRARFKRAKQS